MACQDCSKVYCGNCNGPNFFSRLNYKARIRKIRRQTIYQKKVGKYTNNFMVGCAECGSLNCSQNICDQCLWLWNS